MTSLATMSNINTGSDTALAVIQQAVKSTIYQDAFKRRNDRGRNESA